MSSLKESRIIGYPNLISYESTVKIKEQMEKNICKINIGDEQGTGFFCKIPFPDKNNMIPVLITNNHVIDEKILSEKSKKIPVIIKEKDAPINLILQNRIKYTNESYDITIIKLEKEEEDIINNFLELDDIIIDDIMNISNQISQYTKDSQDTIYIIQYPNEKLSVSYGVIYSIFQEEYNFNYKCSTDFGSSGSPILRENNKVIGVHKEGNKGKVNYNTGTFLNYPIKDFIQRHYKDNIDIKDRNTKINIIKKPSEYPKEITFNCTKKILEQMENNICQIIIGQKQATGFFCEIPFPDRNNKLNVLITSDIINNVNTIPIIFQEKNEEDKNLEINWDNKKKNTFENFGLTIIEIKKEDNIKHFLEIDDSIVDDIIKENNQKENNQKKNNNKYKNETIYITQYSNENLSVSYGIINEIYENNNFFFQHKCITNKGSSGSPIFNLNNKIIGIHKEYNNYYNKGIFLNSAIKEFIKINDDYIKQINSDKNQKKFFNEFSKKYKIKNCNINCTSLILPSNKPLLKNDGLYDLCHIKLKNLKNLSLFGNKISSIVPLKNAKFDKLEELTLSQNNISDISVLEKVNFKNLKVLNLGSNNISDINVLEKVKFKELEELFLDENKISDISVLDKVNFEKLKVLKLNGNKIDNVDIFENSNFPELENLNLAKNQIKNVDSLGNANFTKGLKDLYLNNNPDIKDISKLKNFKNLNRLFVLMQNNIDRMANEKTINYFRDKKENKEMEIFN